MKPETKIKLSDLRLNDGTHGLPKNPRFIRDERLCGVYAIKSLIDDRIYVGSSVDICERWRMHKRDLRVGRHHSNHLQRFFNKYGADSLSFEILQHCGDGVDPRDEEQRFIDALHPAFNVCLLARSCLGVKRSAECKERNRLAQIKRDLRGERNPMFGTNGNKSPCWGKKHKPETIAKMKANHRPCRGIDNPNYGTHQSPEQTAKAAATKRDRLIKRTGGVYIFKNDERVYHGASINECAGFMGVGPSSVLRAYKKGKPCRGFTIQKPSCQ